MFAAAQVGLRILLGGAEPCGDADMVAAHIPASGRSSVFEGHKQWLEEEQGIRRPPRRQQYPPLCSAAAGEALAARALAAGGEGGSAGGGGGGGPRYSSLDPVGERGSSAGADRSIELPV